MSCPQCVQAGKEKAVNHSKSDADLLVLLIVETTICPMVNKFISEQRKKNYIKIVTGHESDVICHV